MEPHDLKARPAVIGQRGAPMVNPAARQDVTKINLTVVEIKTQLSFQSQLVEHIFISFFQTSMADRARERFHN